MKNNKKWQAQLVLAAIWIVAGVTGVVAVNIGTPLPYVLLAWAIVAGALFAWWGSAKDRLSDDED